MQPLKSEVGQELLPPCLSGAQLLLGFEESIGHIVSDHCKDTPQQVVSPLLQAVNHNRHLLLMSGVPLLSIVQVLTFKRHRVPFLHQDSTQGFI